MALGKNENNLPSITFVNLVGGPKGGFMHQTGVSTNDDGSVTRHKTAYANVTGKLVTVKVEEQLKYGVAKKLRDQGMDPRKADLGTFKPFEKHWVGRLVLRDHEDVSIGVGFDLDESMGAKLAGLLNAHLMAGDIEKPVMIRMFHAAAGSKYTTSPKGSDTLNMSPYDPAGRRDVKVDDVVPVFLKDDGSVLMNQAGDGPGMAPMGEMYETRSGSTEWDFSARDNVVMNTIVPLVEHFATKDKPAPADGDVDLAEAAHAATPRG